MGIATETEPGSGPDSSLPAHLPAVFLPRAVITRNSDGLPVAHEMDARHPSGSKEIAFVINDPLLRHYAHFLEVLIAVYSLHKEFFEARVVNSFFVGPGTLENAGQNYVQRDLLKILYPSAEVIENHEGTREAQNVIVINRSDHRGSFLNKFLEPYWSLAMKWVPALRRSVFEAIQPPFRWRAKPRVLYVHRIRPRTLGDAAQNRLFHELRKCNATVETVDFAKLPWPDQVIAAFNADLLVGVHGNGLSNVLWLHDGASVLEMFPAGMHHYDFQMLAEFSGLNYCGLEAVEKGGFVCRDFSRFGPAVHGPSALLRILPWDMMSTWIRRTLAH